MCKAMDYSISSYDIQYFLPLLPLLVSIFYHLSHFFICLLHFSSHWLDCTCYYGSQLWLNDYLYNLYFSQTTYLFPALKEVTEESDAGVKGQQLWWEVCVKAEQARPLVCAHCINRWQMNELRPQHLLQLFLTFGIELPHLFLPFHKTITATRAIIIMTSQVLF